MVSAVRKVLFVLSLVAWMLAVVPFAGSVAVRSSGRGAVVARAFERVPCSAVKVEAAGRVIVAGSLPALKAAHCGISWCPRIAAGRPAVAFA